MWRFWASQTSLQSKAGPSSEFGGRLKVSVASRRSCKTNDSYMAFWFSFSKCVLAANCSLQTREGHPFDRNFISGNLGKTFHRQCYEYTSFCLRILNNWKVRAQNGPKSSRLRLLKNFTGNFCISCLPALVRRCQQTAAPLQTVFTWVGRLTKSIARIGAVIAEPRVSADPWAANRWNEQKDPERIQKCIRRFSLRRWALNFREQ